MQDIDSIDIAPRIITKDIYIKNISFPITTSIQGGVTASPLTWLAQSVERGSNKPKVTGSIPVLSITFNLSFFVRLLPQLQPALC